MSSIFQSGRHIRLSILVVEDSDLLRKMFYLTFGHTHSVYMTSSMETGWELYLEKMPDIIFMDIGLPDGNGNDLARMIKEKNRAAYIIMATANGEMANKIEAVRNHADGFITKPFSKEAINDCLEQYIALRRRAQ